MKDAAEELLTVVRLTFGDVFFGLSSGRNGGAVRKTTGIFDRVFGVDRSVRLAPLSHPAYLLGFMLLLIPNTALSQSGVNSGASWSQYKSQCGIPTATAYSEWDGTCPNSKAGGTGNRSEEHTSD